MYAVIETGGKQYRVEVGTELTVELLDAEPGQAITFDRVLLVGDGDATAVGRPIVANAAVDAEVVRRGRGEKLIVFKYRPKARTRVKKGHRQDHLVLRVTDVKVNGRSAAEETRKAQDDARTERQRLEEAAARQAAADAELAEQLARKKAETTAPPPATKSRRGGRAQPATVESAPPEPAAEPAARAARTRTQPEGDAPQSGSVAAEETGDAVESADATTDPEESETNEPAPKRGRERKDG